ncbi:hypothetical protein EQG63_07940 [Flavobacterium amnicola]|uniref:Uncharacterized protein n=1 Tax=Flavobacterium amnicola TaxID=2506422 RepID=A0A4Q1K433_9FLAO|nr:hypothetical protein [Flavobacterium amnicola]RXR19362.1 hypothetical protein EQG63_07940 [Flavobacterium amnicola]
MKTQILPFLLVTSFLTFAQSQEGYWDNQRVTNKEIQLSRGEKMIVKSEDFPIGTTEFAYRITLLDENQKMVSDLASVLKAIPDPYYISKGTGSAISLLSNISGSDKCTYAIFPDNTKASDFIGSESVEKACLYQKNPVSKDAKVVSLAKNTCLDDEASVVWFVFKNENWVMTEKIILEIVPWVDYQARKGWTTAAKNSASTWVSNYIKSIDSKYRGTSGNFLKSLYQEFDAEQFATFTEEQKKALFEKYNAQFKSKLETNRNYYKEASDWAKKENYAEAISVLEEKIASKPPLAAQESNLLGELYLKTNQIEKAFITLKNASTLFPENLFLKLNLAHAFMFKDEVAAAKKIHKQFMSQNISAKQTWKNKAINDLNDFKKSNVPQKNIDKIWRLYN